MSFPKLGTVLCLVLSTVVASNGFLKFSPGDPCSNDNQDFKKYFFSFSINHIHWFHVTAQEDLYNILTSRDCFMVSIDIYLENDNIMVSPGYSLKDFVLVFDDDTRNWKRYGAKYNIRDGPTFEKLLETKHIIQNHPQFFHIKKSLIGDIYDIFKDHTSELDCYTYSFGWDDGECPFTETDVNEMITNVEIFGTVRKNLDINIASMYAEAIVDKIRNTFDTITYVMNDKNARCASPKTYFVNVYAIEVDYGDQLMIDETIPNFLDTHIYLCGLDLLFVEKHRQPTILDMDEFTWKLVTKIEDLDDDFKENIIKVNIISKTLREMFLGKSFEEFITKFLERRALNGLQLNFKNQDALDAFWNIEHSYVKILEQFRELSVVTFTNFSKDIELFQTLSENIAFPFSIKFEPELNGRGNKFAYEKYRWLDCYTVFIAAEADGESYEKTTIEEIIALSQNICTKAGEIVISLNLKRAIDPASKEAIDLIESNNNYVLNVIDETHSADKKKVRTFLKQHFNKIFFDYGGFEEQMEIFKGFPITDLIPGVSENLTLLKFSKDVIDAQVDLTNALKTPNIMIQVTVQKHGNDVRVGSNFQLETCLNYLAETNANGIKLQFENNGALRTTLDKKYLKYLNFPVWLEFNVLRTNAITLDEETVTDLEKLGFALVLSTDDTLNAIDLRHERNKIDPAHTVLFKVQVNDITKNNLQVSKLFKNAKEDMLLTMLPEETVISKDLRKMFPANVKYYLNIPDRLILEECPNIERNDIKDLSKFLISDYVTSVEEVEKFIGHFDMIRARITLNNLNKLFVDENIPLNDFFEKFESLSKDKPVGMVFTVETQEVYEEVMKLPGMKTFGHPIWFDVKVDNAESVTTNELLEVNCNKLDCSKLILRVITDEGYVEAIMMSLKGIDPGGDWKSVSVKMYPMYSDNIIGLNYKKYNDKLDCRTLLLGINTKEEYSQDDINNLKRIHADRDWKYVFDLKYAKKSWSILKGLVNSKHILLRGDASFNFNSAELRAEFKNIHKLNIIFDIEGRKKYSLWNCPENQDIFMYFRIREDVLSELVFSDFITNKNDIENAVKDKIHMLNVIVQKKNNDVIVSDGFTLMQLLEFVDEYEKLGIKLTFELPADYEAVMSDTVLLKKLKSMNRPIWINANVLDKNGKVHINLDYDKNDDILDCRPLSLGWLGTTEDKYSDKNLKAMKGLSLGPNDRMYVVDMIHVVNTFSSIKDILLMDETTGVKPGVESEKVRNGNKIMLFINDDDIGKLDTAGLKKILDENEELFFLDMTFRARKLLFNGGSAALSSSLILTLVLVFVTLVYR